MGSAGAGTHDAGSSELMGGIPLGARTNNLVRHSLEFMAKNSGLSFKRGMAPTIRGTERREGPMLCGVGWQ